MTNGTQWHSSLVRDPWFSALPAFLQDSLMHNARQRRVTAGNRVFKRGDAACGLYALMAGSLRFNGVDQQRDNHLPDDVRWPYWFGELSLFDPQPRTHDVFARNLAIVLHISQSTLVTLLDEQPRYWRYFTDLLGRKLGLKVPVPAQLTLMPTSERVAFRLLMLSEGYGEVDNSRRIVELEHLASDSCLGLVPEVLERELHLLHAEQIVRFEQDAVSILNSARLRRAAEHRLTL